MQTLIDLKRYPLDQEGSPPWHRLVEECKAALGQNGMFNLEEFLLPGVAQRIATTLEPAFAERAFTHRRSHNIYFKPRVAGLDPSHPALAAVETVSHTLCADQIESEALSRIYDFPPLVRFLAAVMEKAELHAMQDPLARLNVMAYRTGEALNWHFDRSEFTTTLLLQAPQGGGAFEYRTNLRSDDDPNYDGVARLLQGADPALQSVTPVAGTLNVFRGKNTAHRVTPVEGSRDRIIAVFSYYDRPGVLFSPEERIGFYGRAA